MIETVANKFEQNTVSYFLVTMNSSRQFIKKVGYKKFFITHFCVSNFSNTYISSIEGEN